MANKGHLGAVYAGRLIAGLGIGQTTVVAPVYIAEIAPSSVRGACTCFFTGAVYIGVIIAYVANYGTSRSMPNSIGRWVSLTATWHHKIKVSLIVVIV
jgi:MFS family permease